MSSKSVKEVENVLVAEEKKKLVSVETKEKALPYEVLKANCRKLFGVSTSTFVGVTADMESGAYKVSEMKTKINEWLDKEVK